MIDTWPLVLTGSVLVLMAAIPANGVVAEFRRVPWGESALGKVLFMKALSLALVLDLSLVGAILVLFEFGRPTWFEILRLVVFLGVSISLWVQWRVYRRILNDHAQAALVIEDDADDARTHD